MITPPESVAPVRGRTPWEVQRAVLFALLLRESKARVGGQWVGAVWTLFEPLAHTLIFLTILVALRGRAVPGVEVAVWLAVGLLPFFLFQNLATRLMDGIDANRGLFSYRQVKPLDTLVSRATVETLMNLLVYAFTLGILGWLGFHTLPVRPLEAMGVHVVIIVLGTAFGILAAVISHERARLRSFIRMTMMPLYFASGVIIPLDLVPPDMLAWLLLNPLAHLLDLSRQAFLPGHVPLPGVDASYPAFFALVLLALALSAYRADRLRLVTST